MGSCADAENVLNWDSLGIADMSMPKIAGTYSGLLIIAAGGRCVWDDLDKAGMAKNQDHDVMCVNDIIMHYPGPIEHAYSNDATWLKKWIDTRRQLLTRHYGPVKHTHSVKSGGRHTWPFPGHGTSGLNAVYIGLALGYERIWLCGLPLDDSGHYFDAPWIKSNFVREVSDREHGPRYWENAEKRIFKGKVKSFSGRTRKLLGVPER